MSRKKGQPKGGGVRGGEGVAITSFSGRTRDLVQDFIQEEEAALSRRRTRGPRVKKEKGTDWVEKRGGERLCLSQRGGMEYLFHQEKVPHFREPRGGKKKKPALRGGKRKREVETLPSTHF